MEEIKTKVCTTCGKELPLSEFSPNKRYSDGLACKCKECTREYYREYNKRKREERLADKEAGRMSEIIPKSTVQEDVLMDFLLKVQPRYLMKALYKRGYDGDLTYTEKHIINVGKVGRD